MERAQFEWHGEKLSDGRSLVLGGAEERDADNSEVMQMSGAWTSDEMIKSFTWRELETVRIIFCLTNQFIYCNLYWYTYCKNVLHIFRNGSKISELQYMLYA